MVQMNEVQVRAFWAWYLSAYNGSFSKRCLTKAAERSGHGVKLLTAWHKQFAWDELAAKYDGAVNAKLETKIVQEIVVDINAARARQKKIVDMIHRKLLVMIEASDFSNAKIPDIVKFFEFELSLYGTSSSTQSGELLAIVLRKMTPEKRTEFYECVERARDDGEIRFEPLGSPGRN